MKESIRLEHIAQRMTLFYRTILRNMIRIKDFSDKSYVNLIYVRFVIMTKDGDTIEVENFDEFGAKTWDGKLIPYYMILETCVEELYIFPNIDVKLKFITRLRKTGFTRTVVFKTEKEEKLFGMLLKPLSEFDKPFIEYRTLTCLVKNLKKRNMRYALTYDINNGISVSVDHNNRFHMFRTCFNDSSKSKYNRLIMDVDTEHRLTATQALAIIGKK